MLEAICPPAIPLRIYRIFESFALFVKRKVDRLICRVTFDVKREIPRPEVGIWSDCNVQQVWEPCTEIQQPCATKLFPVLSVNMSEWDRNHMVTLHSTLCLSTAERVLFDHPTKDCFRLSSYPVGISTKTALYVSQRGSPLRPHWVTVRAWQPGITSVLKCKTWQTRVRTATTLRNATVQLFCTVNSPANGRKRRATNACNRAHRQAIVHNITTVSQRNK